MTRPPASRLFAPGLAVVAALAQVGCGGGSEAPATPPVASAGLEEPPPQAPARTAAPTPVPAPAPRSAPAYVASPPPRPSEERTASQAPAESAQPATEDAHVKAEEQAAAALKWMEERQARQAEYQQRLAAASQLVADAETRLAEGERTLQEFRNPYLPRPKLSEEDAAAVQGKGGAERIQMAQDRLTELRTARDAAQKGLDDLKSNPPQ